jgi:hypothetical protein
LNENLPPANPATLSDWKICLLVCSIFVALIPLCQPFINAPSNDDWIFAYSAFKLANTGHFSLDSQQELV